MATTPLTMEIMDDGRRPIDWAPRKLECSGPLRLARLCILGMLLPAILVAGPVYLRYKVYSEQLYPLAATDQRLIDGKISTTWCQRQVVKVNTTFNAYLINGDPQMKVETTPVSMTRHLVLEDDMKEYWGFYLLKGSSVTVSTCVRWPGASLTIIRGHKHLHECAFIGDDSSEELEELLEIAEEQGLLNGTGYPLNQKTDGPSNEPDKMKKADQDVQFHHKGNAPHSNGTLPRLMSGHHYTSHELGAKEMRHILTNLFAKTLVAKNKQKENPHHHYEGVYREDDNIEKPPPAHPDEFLWDLETVEKLFPRKTATTSAPTTTESSTETMTSPESLQVGETIKGPGAPRTASSEVLEDVLKRIDALGDRGKRVLEQLSLNLRERQMNENKGNEPNKIIETKREKRQLVLSSASLVDELTRHDAEEDLAVEKVTLSFFFYEEWENS
uniref:NAB6_0 protein n=1 Tax=Fopius arisanus TaxID=64838 RepID=A0A0C9RP70_9HYME